MRHSHFVRAAAFAQLLLCSFFLLPSVPQAFSIQSSWSIGHSQSLARFGSAVAFGDFDGNGRDDFAVGIPLRTENGIPMAGMVCLHFSANNAFGLEQQCVSQARFPAFGPVGLGDQFGHALAFGDFDNDGYDDLAVGVPYENIGSLSNAGAVQVLYGNPNRSFVRSATLFEGSPRSQRGNLEAEDRFGQALAVGDFNADGFDDLAVGVPGETINSAPAAGSVHVVYGGAGGLGPRDQIWSQDQPGIQETAALGDQFGYSLATGKFDGDANDDLAIGVPFEDLGSAVDAGAVHVIYGDAGGLTAAYDQLWHQNFVTGVTESSDRFGFAVAGGDLNGDGIDDLAIGVPGEDPCETSGCSPRPNGGGVHVLRGAQGGLSLYGNAFLLNDSFLPQTGDQVGYALTFGELHGDAIGDLVVGVPGRNVVVSTGSGLIQAPDAGAIVVISGARGDSFPINRGAYLHQNDGSQPDLESDLAETGDRFGSSLAAGDFNGDGKGDLVVGVPFEDIRLTNIYPDAGAVVLIWGPPH